MPKFAAPLGLAAILMLTAAAQAGGYSRDRNYAPSSAPIADAGTVNNYYGAVTIYQGAAPAYGGGYSAYPAYGYGYGNGSATASASAGNYAASSGYGGY